MASSLPEGAEVPNGDGVVAEKLKLALVGSVAVWAPNGLALGAASCVEPNGGG